MSKEQMTIDLDFTDPLLRARVRHTVRGVSDALTWLVEDLERAEKRADTYLDTLTDDLILTRLFCGVAFAAAQAMIDGTREAPREVEIARRAVACKAWRWMPGMMVNSGGTIYRMTEETIALGCGSPEYQREYMRPDLTDPATLGCLLDMARYAWADPFLSAQGRRNIGWRLVGGKQHGSTFNRMAEVWHDFEASALVAALEAAP